MRILTNSYKPNTTRPMCVQPTEAQLLNEINQSISNDETIWVASGSRAAAERIFHLLQAEHPHKKGLLITSKTHNNNSTTAFMANPNSECERYDYIIASPSAGTGVSVDVKGIFDHVYGIFRALPITHTDALQALARVREKVPVTVWIEKRRLDSPESPEEVSRTYLEAMEHAENLISLRMDGSRYSISPEYEALHCEVVAHENRSRNRFFDNFIRQAENEGFSIQQVEEDYTDKEQGKLLRKEGKELARKAYEESIINATNVSDNIHEKLLEASDDIKQENEPIITRSHLSRFYGIDDPTDADIKALLALDNQGKLQRSIKQLEILAIKKEEAIAIDHEKMTNPDRFRHKTRPITPIHEIMNAVLEFVGISYDEEAEIFRCKEIEWTQHHIPDDLVSHIKDHACEINEFLHHRIPADFEENPIRFIHTLLSAFGITRSKSKKQIARQGPDHLFNNNKEIPLDPARRVFHYRVDTERLDFLNRAILHRKMSAAGYHWRILAEIKGNRV